MTAGLGQFTARAGTPAGATAVAHAAAFADGEWRVQFTRALVPADTAAALAFVTGRAIPIAFSAADGSNGEDHVRAAVSTWYAIYLDAPTPRRVYVAPTLSTLVTAALGFLLVSRTQRRERRAADSHREDR